MKNELFFQSTCEQMYIVPWPRECSGNPLPHLKGAEKTGKVMWVDVPCQGLLSLAPRTAAVKARVTFAAWRRLHSAV